MRGLFFLVLVFLLSGCVDEPAYSIEAYVKESSEVRYDNFIFKKVYKYSDSYKVLLGLGPSEEKFVERVEDIILMTIATKGLEESNKVQVKLESSYKKRVIELCPGNDKDGKELWGLVGDRSLTITLVTARQARLAHVRCKRSEG